MALEPKDIEAIEKMVSKLLDQKLADLKNDVGQMKKDVGLLASLAQLDSIRKEPRLIKMYAPNEEAKEM